MADTHETIEDIIAEMRGIRVREFQDYADRFEAARKRERGDCAKLREALKHIKDRLPHMLQYMRVHWEDASAGGYFDELMLVIDAALSAPPRNCDLFATVDEAHKRERGDCAKLREAAESALIVVRGILDDTLARRNQSVFDCRDKLKSALAAPPRNCDKYATFRDAIRALADKRGWHDGKWNSERYCFLAQWLFATATEKEGGNDGNE